MTALPSKVRSKPPGNESSDASPRGRFASLDQDKLRGGYYTSAPVARWLCEWAIQCADDLVLEPSCGDGTFLEAALDRYRKLGATPEQIANRLRGVEIVPAEVRRARHRLSHALGPAADDVVQSSDFFGWWQAAATPEFDAIVGNPPFIRYQSFPEPPRTRAMTIMSAQGLRPNRLTNIWVPFVVAAVASLRAGGRLAFVLPAEILQVTYAAQLRSYLTDRFQRIDVIACNQLFFEKAEQEVVLLLAAGSLPTPTDGNTCRVAMTEALTVAEITDQTPATLLKAAEAKTIYHDSEKWLKFFLDNKQIAFMRELRDAAVSAPLGTHASIDVGVVTGRNEFFVLSGSQVAELGLDGYTTPLVSRSMHLRGTRLRKVDWQSLSEAGGRVHLLNVGSTQGQRLNRQLTDYIAVGESKGFHKGYKCSIRKPWFAVPSVWVPDGFVFRQIYDFPRTVLNASDATSTDTIHRLRSKGAAPERIIANTYTWMTAASAEIEGRSYGGGVLELEPTEAERLLTPATLNGAMPLSEVDRLTRSRRLLDVLEENARTVLRGHMGLSAADSLLLKDIWTKMRERRMARRRRATRTTENPLK